MGLDIYVYKTTMSVNTTDLDAIYKKGNEVTKETFGKAYKRAIKALTKAAPDEYEKKYISTLKKLGKLTNFPYFDLKGIGYCMRDGKTNFEVKNLDEFIALYDDTLSHICWKYEGYFRKVYFIFDFFKTKGKLIDDDCTFATTEEVAELLKYCDDKLKSPFLSEYEERDLLDCKKQFTKLVNGLNDDETLFIEFSY